VAERAFHTTPVADAGYLAGGAALFASAFLQWVTEGPGSGLRGHALVDAVVALGRQVPAMSTGRLTILWYLVPALGAASWVVGGLRGARDRVSRVVAGAAFTVSIVVALAFIRLVGLSGLGWGSKVAVAGAVVLCASAWWPPKRAGVSGGRGSDPSP
jgi:hypothetical protein